MNEMYEKCKVFWDDVFSQEEPIAPTKLPSDPDEFDKALQWLCEGSESVLDFGCGNGVCLFFCALYGAKRLIGIDLSETAIKNAKTRALQMSTGAYQLLQGGVEQMQQVETDSIDAVLLSNILDNLYPEDAHTLLQEVCRVLRHGGKVFAKFNPYLTASQIRAWNIKVIEDNLLDDGLLLWNNTTEEWTALLSQAFSIVEQKDIYHAEHDQYSRLFLLTKA